MNSTLPLWQLINDWLILTGNRVNKSYCKGQITSHHDYPALTSAIDFLDTGNMRYQAVKADASCFKEFNYPVLAHIKEPGNEYMHIIKEAADWDIEKDKTKHWSGITIFPEKNAAWKNAENNAEVRKQQRQNLCFASWCCVGISLFTASVYFLPSLLYNVFGFLSLAGIFISIAAFSTELGIQSNAVKQVCGAVSHGGCEQVLQSKFAKGAFGITPSDLSVLYFAAQFIAYLVAAFFHPVFTLLPYLAVAGILVAGVSVYTQAFILKQWCALCLGIVGVLILQAALAIFLLAAITLSSLVIFTAITILLPSILLPLKALLKTIIDSKPKLAELNKWKSDAGLFMMQLDQEQEVNTTTWENDLIIGNADAPIRITVACNPYCGPCASAHKELDKLLEKCSGKVSVQVRWLCNPLNEKSLINSSIEGILKQAVLLKSTGERQEMLSDWFSWMDLEKWKIKWDSPNEINVTDVIAQHDSWIKASKISFTPTFFVNGKKLPGRYLISDIKDLIPQLVD